MTLVRMAQCLDSMLPPCVCKCLPDLICSGEPEILDFEKIYQHEVGYWNLTLAFWTLSSSGVNLPAGYT